MTPAEKGQWSDLMKKVGGEVFLPDAQQRDCRVVQVNFMKRPMNNPDRLVACDLVQEIP